MKLPYFTTCEYAAGGMPLAVTQEDFLVYSDNSSLICHLHYKKSYIQITIFSWECFDKFEWGKYY